MSKGVTLLLLLHCGVSLTVVALGVFQLLPSHAPFALAAALLSAVLCLGAFRFLLPQFARTHPHKEDAVLLAFSAACVTNYFSLLLEFGMARKVGIGYGWLEIGLLLGFLVGLLPWIYWQSILYQRERVQRQHAAAVVESRRLRELDRSKDAEDKLKESLLLCEVTFGSDHIQSAQAASDLAALYLELNERGRAARMMRRALTVRRSLLGNEDLRVSMAVIEWAGSDDNLEPEQALQEMRQALLNLERQLGAYAPAVAIAYERMGHVHLLQKQNADAENALRRSYSILKKAEVDAPLDVFRIGLRLVQCYLELERLGEAETFLAEIQPLTAQQTPQTQLEALLVRMSIQSAANQADAAQESAWQALQLMQTELGPEHAQFKDVWQNCLEKLSSPYGDPAAQAILNSIFSGDSFTIRQQLQAHPDWIQQRDALGWNFLQWCCFFGHERLVETLTGMGASLDEVHDEWPPFQIACRWAHRRLISLLASRVASVDQLAVKNWHALHRCAQNGDDRTLDVLTAKELNFNCVNERGDTPLLIACRRGHYLFVVGLVGRGADVTQVNPQSGRSPLHEAAYIGHRAIAECLLLNGAAVDVKDRAGLTPLELAIQAEKETVVKQLQAYSKGLKA